jgi:cytochrome c biogenesis protein CcmG/thiol:disulfide interchange protein DsbE
MLTSWKFWVVMLFIAGLTSLFAFGFTRNPKIVESPLVGQPAPGFSLTEMNTGVPLDDNALRGTPYLLNFWASWCTACREEAPYLKLAYENYEARGRNFRVIGIAIQDTLEKARAFAQRYGKAYYLALDDEQGSISLNWGLYGVPETFFVNAKGIITHKHIGALTWHDVETEVERLLESAPTFSASAPPTSKLQRAD